MTPVLVILTDKTLYVTDLVRNRLCNKFVLPYTELDVILVSVSTFYKNQTKFVISKVNIYSMISHIRLDRMEILFF